MGSNFDKIWRPSWIPMDIKGQHIVGTKGLTETSNTIFSYDSHVGNSMESSIFEFIYYMTIYSKVLLYFWRKWRNISALIRQNLFCTTYSRQSALMSYIPRIRQCYQGNASTEKWLQSYKKLYKHVQTIRGSHIYYLIISISLFVLPIFPIVNLWIIKNTMFYGEFTIIWLPWSDSTGLSKNLLWGKNYICKLGRPLLKYRISSISWKVRIVAS